MSVGGTALTTTQLRADLPAGLGNGWSITKMLSYSFLLATQIKLVLPLATLYLCRGSGWMFAHTYQSSEK